MTLVCDATLLRHEVRRSAVGMTDHEHVDVHGLDVAQGVEQGFALDRAGLCNVDIKHIGRQAFRGQLECGPCASTGLEKEVDDSLAAQQRDLLDGLFGNAGKGFCGIEQLGEQLPVQPADGEKMTQAAITVDLQIPCVHVLRRISSFSGSGPVSLICSSSCSAMRRPTTSAAIGSSRPPRSINAASVMDAGRP